MNLTVLIIGSLAVHRLSHAIVKEGGPLMAFARLRAFAARVQKRSGGFFDMLSCVYCVSFWIGLIASLWCSGDVFHKLAYAFAFSGVAYLLERLTYDPNSFTVVAPPTAHNKIPISIGSTPKKGSNMVSNPSTPDGFVAVKTKTPLSS